MSLTKVLLRVVVSLASGNRTVGAVHAASAPEKQMGLWRCQESPILLCPVGKIL